MTTVGTKKYGSDIGLALGYFANVAIDQIPDQFNLNINEANILEYSEFDIFKVGDKIYNDFWLSNLDNISHLREANKSSISLINRSKVNTLEIDDSSINKDSFRGRVDNNFKSILENKIQSDSKPIRVNCSSIRLGALATLIRISKYLDLDIDFSSNSGTEQANLINKDPDFDIIICADSPLLYERNGNIKNFTRTIPIYNECQSVFKKIGSKINGNPCIYLLPKSSTTHQFELNYDHFKCIAGSNISEMQINSIDEYSNISKNMYKNDIVLAWEPISSELRKDRTLKEDKNLEFLYPVSIYFNNSWQKDTAEISSFINIFIAEWNQMQYSKNIVADTVYKNKKLIDKFTNEGSGH